MGTRGREERRSDRNASANRGAVSARCQTREVGVAERIDSRHEDTGAGRRRVRRPAHSDASWTRGNLGAITDAKGNFAITGIIPGSYQLSAGRPGYAIAPVTISLTANEKVTKPLSAAQLARIAGTIVDEQKRPIAAARVATQNVSRGGGGPMNFMTMNRAPQAAASAPDGTFIVRADGDTDIEVEALKKGFPQAKSAKLRLAPGERKSGIVLTIPNGVNVTGRVLDKGGKPIAGATVVATESTAGGGGGNFMRRVVGNAMRQRDDDQIKSGKDGTLRDPSQGRLVRLRVQGRRLRGEIDARGADRREPEEPFDVTLDPGVEITGRVTRSGAGVEGVRINLIGEGGMAGNEMTGPDGSFRLNDLSPGQFMLNAMKEEEFIQQIRPVTAPATDVNIDVPAGGRVSGHVVDKTSKQPVTAFEAGVSTPRGGGGMMFMMPPAMRHFTTDDGTFVLENVPPGQTQIVVNAPGYTSAHLPNINVEDGKSLPDVEVDMDHGVRAVGHVTGSGWIAARRHRGAARHNRRPRHELQSDAEPDRHRRERRLHDGFARSRRQDVRVHAQRLPDHAEDGHAVRDGNTCRRSVVVRHACHRCRGDRCRSARRRCVGSIAQSASGRRLRESAHARRMRTAHSNSKASLRDTTRSSARRPGYADGRLQDFDITAWRARAHRHDKRRRHLRPGHRSHSR